MAERIAPGLVAGQVMEHPDQGCGIEGLACEIIDRAMNNGGPIQQIGFSDAGDSKVKHRLGGIDRYKAPAGLHGPKGHDLLGPATRSGHENASLGPAPQGSGEHAGGELVTGIIACQTDPALLLILTGPARVELAGRLTNRCRHSR